MNIQQWHYIIKTIDDNEIINDTLETDLKASEICKEFEDNGFEVLVLERASCGTGGTVTFISLKEEFAFRKYLGVMIR